MFHQHCRNPYVLKYNLHSLIRWIAGVNNRILKMTIQCVLIIAACLSVLMASGCGSTSLVPKANAMVDAMAKGEYTSAVSDVSTSMKDVVSPEQIKSFWTGLTEKSGVYVGHTGSRQSQNGDYRTVDIQCQFQNANWLIAVDFDADDKVIGIQYWFTETKYSEGNIPAYINRERFDERTITFHSGGGEDTDYILRVEKDSSGSTRRVSIRNGTKKVTAILSVPRGTGPFPLVILVPDTLVNGANGTGPAKPLHDIAWGLASQGISTLRYDNDQSNRNYTKTWTVNEDVVNDVAAAITSVRDQNKIDVSRIYVLGHGLAGFLAPRIGRDINDIAGLIVMAGFARPLQDVVRDIHHYHASISDPYMSDFTRSELAKIDQDTSAIKNLSPNADPSTLLLDLPVSYWGDLQGYVPADVAKDLAQPMLIMHGGRDYVATSADLKQWKQGPGSRSNVTVKLYPDLNHILMSGTGKSTPVEYGIPGHVPEQVITDISNWIHKQK